MNPYLCGSLWTGNKIIAIFNMGIAIFLILVGIFTFAGGIFALKAGVLLVVEAENDPRNLSTDKKDSEVKGGFFVMFLALLFMLDGAWILLISTFVLANTEKPRVLEDVERYQTLDKMPLEVICLNLESVSDVKLHGRSLGGQKWLTTGKY